LFKSVWFKGICILVVFLELTVFVCKLFFFSFFNRTAWVMEVFARSRWTLSTRSRSCAL
jgi:hypothetical protein